MSKIRKISYGPDYKDCMHVTVGQSVIGDNHTVREIKNSAPGVYTIYIADHENMVRQWKKIENVPVHIEYDINY